MNSKILILLDINFIKVRNIVKDTKVSKIILVNIYGYMPYIASLREPLEVRFKIDMIKDNSVFIWWNIFMAKAKKSSTKEYAYDGEKNDSAIILHSGGTTGSPKGVVLSNGNLLAYVEICKIVQDNLNPEDTGLALMPIFHSFGIVYNILFPLCKGMKVVLRPKFEIKEYCKMIVKYKPQIISGVPTLFESLLKEWNYQKENLNFLKCAFVAGDTLKPALRDRINSFLQKHNANIRVTEGYGLSEAVAGVVQGMQSIEKEGTTGIPLPGLDVGIFSPDDEEVPYGEEGEICVSGPTVMSGYYNNIEETKVALHIHKDGKTWLHTGDIGTMDEEGFVTYTSRLKRMIVSSGYNVYPNQIERLLEAHSAVKTCSVIGVPHRYKMEVPKAYIVLEQGYTKSEFLIMELKKMCKKNLPKYSWPYQYEFIEKLPTTKVGKIDFRKLKKYSEEHKDD